MPSSTDNGSTSLLPLIFINHVKLYRIRAVLPHLWIPRSRHVHEAARCLLAHENATLSREMVAKLASTDDCSGNMAPRR